MKKKLKKKELEKVSGGKYIPMAPAHADINTTDAVPLSPTDKASIDRGRITIPNPKQPGDTNEGLPLPK